MSVSFEYTVAGAAQVPANIEGEVAGIGPVIAALRRPQPAYYVDLLLQDGRVARLLFPKRGAGLDRLAKNEATRLRNNLAVQLRQSPPGVALLHDVATFDAVKRILRRVAPLPLAA